MTGPNFAPNYWMSETSGVLRPVVEKYLRGEKLTDEEVATMRAYIRQWIFAPVWKGPEIEGLRDLVDSLTTQAQIDTWLEKAAEALVDPL